MKSSASTTGTLWLVFKSQPVLFLP